VGVVGASALVTALVLGSAGVVPRHGTTGTFTPAAAAVAAGATPEPVARLGTVPAPVRRTNAALVRHAGPATPAGGAVRSGTAPLPASSPATSLAVASTPATSLPAPVAGHLPQVTPTGIPREVDAVVALPGTVTSAEIQSLVHTPGLTAIEEVDTGTVTLDGAPATAYGVDPGTFRNFTPAVTAGETALWQYVAAGAMASSYDMASDRRLPLGSRLPIVPAVGGPPTTGWLGAFMSIGIPGVDMIVSHAFSGALGLTPDSGLVVSAPGMNPAVLGQRLREELAGANVELTRPAWVTAAPSTTFVTQGTTSTVISAALSRVGAPYVWGGDGPNGFDCSGLGGWAFAQAGIAMPRTAAQQYLTGAHLTLAQARPGDLLFWHYDPTDPGFIDHVAIYLGNGMMVVAPHTGTAVQVDPVPTAAFAGAVRVDPVAAGSVGGARFP
jgi:hypothetical protein